MSWSHGGVPWSHSLMSGVCVCVCVYACECVRHMCVCVLEFFTSTYYYPLQCHCEHMLPWSPQHTCTCPILPTVSTFTLEAVLSAWTSTSQQTGDMAGYTPGEKDRESIPTNVAYMSWLCCKLPFYTLANTFDAGKKKR